MITYHFLMFSKLKTSFQYQRDFFFFLNVRSGIYLERNTLHRQGCGPLQRASVESLSRVSLFETPRTVATRFLCPWDFPGKSIGVGCRFLLQRIFPNQGIELVAPILTGRFFTAELPRKPNQRDCHYIENIFHFIKKRESSLPSAPPSC